MERVTFEEYEAAKAAVLYGKEYEETSSMENNVIHKQYVCKDGSGIFYERTENDVEEWQIAGINAMFDQCNEERIIPYDLPTAIKGLLCMHILCKPEAVAEK